MSTPRSFTIAAIPADGVGQGVVAAGREVLDVLAANSARLRLRLAGVRLGLRVLRAHRPDDGR